MSTPVLKTNLPFPVRSGKVRDVYDFGDEVLLVSTDRISAFDWILQFDTWKRIRTASAS